MSALRCKCGHTAFDRTGGPEPHICYLPDCRCSRFDAVAPETPTAPLPFVSGMSTVNAVPAVGPDAAERRKFALLQAAAVLLAAQITPEDGPPKMLTVAVAEQLLEIIEAREAARSKEPA